MQNTHLLDGIDLKPLRYVLPNGLCVLLKPEPLASVAIQVLVKTGSIHEGKFEGKGVSHFVEHMLFKGTKNRSATEIRDITESIGAVTNAYTSYDRTVYILNVLKEYIEPAFSLLSDQVFDSTFPLEEFETEKEVIKREIARSQDSQSSTNWQHLCNSIFVNSPSKHPILGYPNLFDKVTREDLIEYYSMRYAPNNCVLAVVGDFDISEVQELINNTFGKFERQVISSKPAIKERKQYVPLDFTYYAPKAELVTFQYAWQVPWVSAKDTIPYTLITQFLTGLEDNAYLKKHTDADFVSGCLYPEEPYAYYIITAQCKPEMQDKVYQQLDKIFSDINSLIPAFKEVRRNIVDSIVNDTIQATLDMIVSPFNYAEYLLECEVGDMDAQSRIKHMNTSITTWSKLDASVMTRVIISPNVAKKATISNDKHISNIDSETILTNGVTILAKALPIKQQLALTVSYNTISTGLNTAEQYILALLLPLETNTYRDGTFTPYLVSMGVQYQTSVSLDGFTIQLSGNPNIDTLLNVLKDSFNQFCISKTNFEKESSTLKSAILHQQQELPSFATEQLRATFFANHPYGQPILGTCDAVDKITIEDVYKLWEKIKGLPCIITVLGQINDVNMAKVNEFGKTLAMKPTTGSISQFTPPTIGRKFIYKDSVQSNVSLAFDGAKDPKNKCIQSLLVTYLSTMSSPLFLEVREKRSLAYSVHAREITGVQGSMLVFNAGISPKNTEKVYETFYTVIKDLKTTFTQLKLDCIKRELIMRYRESKSRTGAMHWVLFSKFLQDLPITDDREAMLNNITLEQVHNFIDTYLSKPVLELVVGPNE